MKEGDLNRNEDGPSLLPTTGKLSAIDDLLPTSVSTQGNICENHS